MALLMNTIAQQIARIFLREYATYPSIRKMLIRFLAKAKDSGPDQDRRLLDRFHPLTHDFN
jgi:hypothetical protein